MLDTKKKYQIELLYGYELPESNPGIYHAFLLKDSMDGWDGEKFETELREMLSPSEDSLFDWDYMEVELPESTVRRIREDAIREYQTKVYEHIIRSLIDNETQYAGQRTRTGELLDCKVRVANNNIICNSEQTAEGIADLLEAMGYCPNTGYYDPEEDKRNGYFDDLTGKWYVEVD